MSRREDWAAWEGPEVEGRLHGIRTLFIGAAPADPSYVERVIHLGTHAHVYFLPEYLGPCGFHLADQAVKRGLAVTLAVTPELLVAAPAELLPQCHVQLILSVPELSIRALKPTDSVRIDVAPYDVLTATAHSFLSTRPVAYNQDRLVAMK